ncbi:ribonuclease H-like domain-containing protein, partial [Tanacetum coccineum]
ARTTTNADGSSTSTIRGPVTIEEKAQKKNDVKERSMLLMALPNEHQLTFSQYKDAKTLFKAIQARFGGNEATKKTQRTLLNSNEDNTVNVQVNTASTNDSIASLSDATIYAFLANQPNRSQRTGKKIIINGSDTAGYDKSKVECFNCHKMRHFARECRGPRNQESRHESRKQALGINKAQKELPFAPPTIDLSSSGLKEFQQPEFEGYGVNVNKSVSENSSNEIKKNTGAPIIEDWVSDCDEDECEEIVSENVQHKSEPKPEQAKQPRKINENPRNNRTNWNEKKTQKLGVGFQFTKKACFVCGSFNHLIKDCDFHDKKMVQKPMINNVQKGTGQREVRPVWNNALRTNHQNFSNSRRNFAPTTVLTKSGIVPISTARQRSSKAAAPLSATRPINTAAPKLCVNAAKTKPNVFQKAHSLSRRPFNQQTALNNRSLNNKINTAKINSVNTAKGKRVTSAVGKQEINAVKSSTCWDDPQVALIDTRIFDSGCARHMTGNKSFLIDYQDYDGGFVAFAGSSKGGRITSKGKIKTGKLDFEDVYFVKELKFNLFSVPQMCDKKNSVLFTETECLILSPDFKLPDENQF